MHNTEITGRVVFDSEHKETSMRTVINHVYPRERMEALSYCRYEAIITVGIRDYILNV